MPEPLLALSVRQPWAHAIVHLAKDIENRKRVYARRGLTLIHASAGMTPAEHHDATMFINSIPGLTCRAPAFHNLERGGIIGAVEIVDGVAESSSPWWMGPRGYVLRNARPLPFIPCKGTVTPLFWAPPPEIQARVRAVLGLLPA